MRRLIGFLNNFPARFPFTCGLVLLYLLVMAFCWSSMHYLGKAPGTAADAALLPFLFGELVTLISPVITGFVFVLELLLCKQKPLLQKQKLLSYLFWLLFLLGLLPIIEMYGPFLLILTGANKQIAEVPYLFASPTQKLKRDIALCRLENIKSDIKQGADINAQDDNRRQTALIWAISAGKYDLANYLIDKRANIYLKDAYGDDALAEAIKTEPAKEPGNPFYSRRSNPERANIALRLMHMGARIHPVKPGECSGLLSSAVETGSKELVDKVLQAELNVKLLRHPKVPFKIGNYCGVTPPLSIAAMEGDNSMIEFLLKRGANVNAVDDEDGTTPLMHAIRQKHPDTAKLLINKGANVNAQAKDKVTPLLLAVIYEQNNELLTSLLNAGADVNAQAKEGSPVLVRAVMTGDMVKVKILLNRGARFNPNSNYGKELLDNAVYGHNPDLVRFFLQKGINPNIGHLLTALDQDQPEITELFLKAGMNPNTPAEVRSNRYNKRKLTPLFEAIWKNDPKLVQLLLEHGAETHVQGALLEGPIEAVIMSPSSEKTLTIIQLLLDHGADINQLDYYGNTALDVATRRRMPEDKLADKIEDLLRKNGGKLNR